MLDCVKIITGLSEAMTIGAVFINLDGDCHSGGSWFFLLNKRANNGRNKDVKA